MLSDDERTPQTLQKKRRKSLNAGKTTFIFHEFDDDDDDEGSSREHCSNDSNASDFTSTAATTSTTTSISAANNNNNKKASPIFQGTGCGTCAGCQIPCCGECKMCLRRSRSGDTTTSACVHRDCSDLDETVRANRKRMAELHQQQVWARGCGTCAGCQIPCCGSCQLCLRRSQSSDAPTSACIHRDCIQLDDTVRANRKKLVEELQQQSTSSDRAPSDAIVLTSTTTTTSNPPKNDHHTSNKVYPKFQGIGCGTCAACQTPCCGACQLCLRPERSSDTTTSACVHRDCVQLDPAIRANRKKMAGQQQHQQHQQQVVCKPEVNESKNGWFIGNGICPVRAAAFETVELKFCGDCEPCKRQACNVCGLCQLLPSMNICVMQCCNSNSNVVRLLFSKEIREMQTRNDRCLEVGDEAYGFWKPENRYYPGTIINKWTAAAQGNMHTFYSVHFADGDKRSRIPEKEMLSMYEMELLQEGDRLEDAMGEAADDSDFKVPAVPRKRRREPTEQTENQRVFSTQKIVGARVYAEWDTDQYYWGTIVKIMCKGVGVRSRKYSILFDDNDLLDGVRYKSIMTEREFIARYGKDPPEPPKSTASSSEETPLEVYVDGASNAPNSGTFLSLNDLSRQCCGECSMCFKADCGLCSSCVTNRSSTSRYRSVCLSKMCKKIPEIAKSQPVHGQNGLRFYFVDQEDARLQSSPHAPFFPFLKCLRLLSENGRLFGSIESAMIASGVTATTADVIAHEFYEEELGLKLRRQLRTHTLLGKPYCRSWTDTSGRNLIVTGTITKCFRSLTDENSLSFSVTYNQPLRDLVHKMSAFEGSIPSIDENVCEQDVWGGYLTSVHKQDGFVSVPDAPFHWNWMVPDMRCESFGPMGPRLELIAMGFRFLFETKQSKIAGAGLGLWLTVESLTGQSSDFTLEPGRLLDLGVYGPMRKDDRKSSTIHHLKNFIYDSRCERFAFDVKGNTHEVIDVTDDKTGALHERAKRNVLVYANETDGNETPSICSMDDPRGSVHYCLGHKEFKQGVLTIPLGLSIEQLIDYGPLYESIRVKEGYSRLSGSDLEEAKRSLDEHETDAVNDISTYSANDIDEALSFLDGLFDSTWMASETHLLRTLIVALSLLGRANVIQNEFSGFNANADTEVASLFCDNGFTSMVEKKTRARAKALIRKVIGKWRGQQDLLRSSILSMPSLKIIVEVSIGCTVDSISACELMESIDNIVRLGSNNPHS